MSSSSIESIKKFIVRRKPTRRTKSLKRIFNPLTRKLMQIRKSIRLPLQDKRIAPSVFIITKNPMFGRGLKKNKTQKKKK